VLDNHYKTLVDSLGRMGCLEVKSISQDEKEIVEKVTDIYMQARECEAANVPSDGDGCHLEHRLAAIEIRNAVLFSELEEIGDYQRKKNWY